MSPVPLNRLGADICLHVLTCNLKRAIKILDIKKLIEANQTLATSILKSFYMRLALTVER